MKRIFIFFNDINELAALKIKDVDIRINLAQAGVEHLTKTMKSTYLQISMAFINYLSSSKIKVVIN